MTLFVVVERRKSTGQEYIAADSSHSGYAEYSAARTDAEAIQEDTGPDWEVFIGRVVPVEEGA